ncbi:MAG: radical SAM protein [Dissulfurispiraceae bacterium]|jgi:AdoMet-dependent heme synthase
MSVNDTHDFFIQWHLTERCNLQCVHCYQEDRRFAELPLKSIKEVIDEAADMIWNWEETYGIKLSMSYNISGGEPLLRSDLFDILEEISWKGANIYILSNGTLIDKEIARKLARIGVAGVQVSIEGPENIHEQIRGKGSFAASIAGVKNLLDAGIAVTLNATLSLLNARYFPEMISLSKSLGVQKLGFSRLVPYGRGAAMLDKMIAADEVKKLYNDIFSSDASPVKIVTGDPIASQLSMNEVLEDTGDNAVGGCAAGVSGMTILTNGTLTPCRRLNIPIGNVLENSLREVWAVSPVLEALRDRKRYEGRCGKCKRWANCRGCRAIAYAYSKANGEESYLAEDPQCYIEEQTVPGFLNNSQA